MKCVQRVVSLGRNSYCPPEDLHKANAFAYLVIGLQFSADASNF